MTHHLPLVRFGQGAFTREIWPHDIDPSFPTHGDPMPATATANPHTPHARHTPHTLMNQISKGRKARPRRVMLYGTHGIGKSTFGAMAEKPIFVPTEDGLADIDCESFPLARSLGEVMAALESLYSGDHDYRTVVIDSLDWLERLIWGEVCADENVENIEKIGYAKGFSFAIDKWRSVLGALDALRSDRGMTVVLIAHAKIEKFENPETVPYDRYSPRLHKLASALVQEWADEVLFATYKVHTVKVDEGFNKAKHNGVSTGERPAHVAKNRLGLPEEIPLDYRVYGAFARGENPFADASAPASTTDTGGAA